MRIFFIGMAKIDIRTLTGSEHQNTLEYVLLCHLKNKNNCIRHLPPVSIEESWCEDSQFGYPTEEIVSDSTKVVVRYYD